jgi:hypothetical protein
MLLCNTVASGVASTCPAIAHFQAAVWIQQACEIPWLLGSFLWTVGTVLLCQLFSGVSLGIVQILSPHFSWTFSETSLTGKLDSIVRVGAFPGLELLTP